MAACPACGSANAADARFCVACGAALGQSAAPDPLAAGRHESRRTVTVLFADVVGSTEMAESLDPEAMRARLSRFYDHARTTLERHGGTVEKYIGDAVMAVFGVPGLHEDDALRAARAAIELRDGAELPIRIGLNTGEVVVGDPAAGTTLVTGDAVNVAARLQAAADTGTVLIGPETIRLLRGAATIERIAPLALKGKAEPLAAAVLVGLVSGHDQRRTGGPFVGRDGELATLRAAFAAARADRSPGLVTIIGQPGVGKSRLIGEFVAAVGDQAQTLTGRCLSYGEGITYWPITEIVRSAAGIADDDDPTAARARIERLLAADPEGATIAGRVAAAIGLDPSDAAAEETPWAIRRLLEIVANQRPLLVIVDDIQWAEPALLDLIEYAIGWATDVPLLVVCLARPELRDKRPDWGESIATARSIRLSALEADDAGVLLDALAGAHLPAIVRDRIVHVSDGNPLFAEELLAMLIEEGHLSRNGGNGWSLTADLDQLAIPPTVGALLSSRLDRLPADERLVLGRSSVVGERFDRAAVLELAEAPERAAVPGRLLALVRRELLRPDRSDLLGGEAFRFRHLLVRDAAYESLPKAERAILHERLADWLVRVMGDRVGEIEAIVGYHYEQALAYRLALSADDPRAADLGRRAAEHLVAAGRRSMEIGAMGAAANTFGRAFALIDPADPSRIELAGQLGLALFEIGHVGAAREITTEAVKDAEALGDERLLLHAQVDAAVPAAFLGHQADAARRAREIADRFAKIGDPSGEAKALQLVGQAEWWHYHVAAAMEAFDRARSLARAAGDRRVERQILVWGMLAYGPTPVPEAIARAEAELRAAGDDVVRRTAALEDLSVLSAYEGNIERARELVAELRAGFATLGRELFLAASREFDAFIEMQDGDLEIAVQELQIGIEALERLDRLSFLPFDLALLARCYAGLHDAPNAEKAIRRYHEVDTGDDRLAESFRERALALLALDAGDPMAAVRHGIAAVEGIDDCDMLGFRGDACFDAAVAFRAARDITMATTYATRARDLYTTKVHRVGMARANWLLAELSS